MSDRDRISSSAEFDHDRYWRFSRNSGLPRDYFTRPRIDPDVIVGIGCLILAVVGLVVAL